MTWRHAGGLLLLAHGLAHTLPGMRAAAEFAVLPTALWAVAVAGFAGAGFGLLGARAFCARWSAWAAAGVSASAWLLIGTWPTPLGHVGLLTDLLVILLIAHRGEWLTDEAAHPPKKVRQRRNAFAIAAVAVLTGLVLARAWHLRWGSTSDELRAAWPGDALVPKANYVIQHAVTIDAAPSAVWPWLAQLGQDRGGFYSYAWLENVFGLKIRNADRVHPEWQSISAGDSVFATPPHWLGLDRRLGWRVGWVEPGRMLLLENWGAFILHPDNGRTRLIVRTRGAAADRPVDLALAPIGLVLFEPAHFLMQRKMLLEIKRHVESSRPALAGDYDSAAATIVK
ncbi:MAG TPA: hypothetical protein VFM14_08015 [Gemmatimonadales bacterium]|nr:hypothetical protein [Gemmatimonadales bacterium]